jgi:hypothetical protein
MMVAQATHLTNANPPVRSSNLGTRRERKYLKCLLPESGVIVKVYESRSFQIIVVFWQAMTPMTSVIVEADRLVGAPAPFDVLFGQATELPLSGCSVWFRASIYASDCTAMRAMKSGGYGVAGSGSR